MRPPEPFNVERDCTCGHRAIPRMAYWPNGDEALTFCCHECYRVWARQIFRLPDPGIEINPSKEVK